MPSDAVFRDKVIGNMWKKDYLDRKRKGLNTIPDDKCPITYRV